MFELGLALLGAICVAALMIVFRRLRSLKRRLDRLVADHDVLANRVLLFTLNRAHAEPIAPATSATSIAPDPNPGPAETDTRRPPIRLVDKEGLPKSERPSESPPFPGREPRRYQ